MKPRARRVTLAAAALGVGVIAVLVVLNWSSVRDHVDAWRFQLDNETRTITPDPALKGKPGIRLSERLRNQVGISRLSLLRLFADYSGIPVVHRTQLATGFNWYLVEECRGLTGDAALRDLRGYGYRVIEQRFPRRAYVVIRDETPP